LLMQLILPHMQLVETKGGACNRVDLGYRVLTK
jgi:hypothetical protein